MITRITKQNRAKYEQLFEEANKVLNLAGDDRISGLETYFNNIFTLWTTADEHQRAKFIRLPIDEDLFNIDLNTRQITVPTSFKKVGLGIQGDKFAEIVYFKVDRYFDTTDLSTRDIYIVWENSKGHKYLDKAYLPDTSTDLDKIIFGWGIGEEITTVPGNIKFSVMFTEGRILDDLGTIIDEKDLQYRLSTLPTTINVNQGLVFDYDGTVNIIDSADQLTARIKNSPSFGNVEAAAEPVILAYKGYAWDWENPLVKDLNELLDDPNSSDIKETGLPILAISPNGGIISYAWLRDGTDSPISSGYRYFLVTEKNEQTVGYYIKEDKDHNIYRFITDSELDELDSLIAEQKVYERIGFLNINEPGTYRAQITNLENGKIKTITTDSAVTIPAASIISNVSITLKDDDEIYRGEDKVLIANVTLAAGDINKHTIEYLWSTGEETKEITIKEAGAYWVKAKAVRNNSDNGYVQSETLNIQESAVKPENVQISVNPENYISKDENTGNLVAKLDSNLLLSLSYRDAENLKYDYEWQKFDTEKNDFYTIVDSNIKDLTYKPTENGLYRALVTNFISPNNKESQASNHVNVGRF